MTKEQEYGLPQKEQEKARKPWLILPFMLVTALVALSVATQYIAWHVGAHQALGSPLFFGQGMYWYWPWSVLLWQDIGIPAELLETALDFAYLSFILPNCAVFVGFIYTFHRMKGNANLHGSARWATLGEIREMGLLDGKGAYIGGYYEKKKKVIHYLRHNGPEHILCFAPTRSGKGVGLILPTLLSWEGSSLTLDIKGENWALTAGFRKSIGHKVLRFNPADVTGSSVRFNPLEEIRLATLFAVRDVQEIALMVVDPGGKGLDDHWTKAAYSFFSGVVLHCCIMIREQKNRPANLSDLIFMLANPDLPITELLDEMLETDHSELLKKFFPEAKGSDEIHMFITSSAQEMKNKDEKEASGVLSSASTNMSLYRDPVVAMNICQSDFQIDDLMNSDVPVDLYIVVTPDNIDRVRPFVRIMLHMICNDVCAEMSFAGGRSVAGFKHRLLFMLDEFPALGKLPSMEKVLPYIAGYGGKMYLITQDTEQLNDKYGDKNSFMANCHVRMAYAPNTEKAAKMLSDMLGKTTVVDKKTSLSGSRYGRMNNASTSVQEVARPLLTPDECSRIPAFHTSHKTGKPVAGDMVIFIAGNNPIYGKQSLYFVDPVFSARAKIEAPAVTDRIYSELSTPDKKEPESKEAKEAKEAKENQVVSSSFSTFLQNEEE